MVRVQQRRAASARPAAIRHRQLINGTKPSYKVVLEQVTQQRKRLITVGSANTQPPPGYTFIPAGDSQITNRCKSLARLDGAVVYVVSTTRHKHSGLSEQVHRIGCHFPSSIVSRACMSLGIELSRSGRVVPQDQGWFSEPKGVVQRTRNTNNDVQPILDPSISQATVDTQARETLKDLFPKIPPKDLHKIVKHAFELGTTRVGTAPELSLPRRVQLAVVAHIRHNYTNYDKLLKQVPYQAARALVEKPTLDKFVQWRGENDEDPNAMEDILREVIVIPDDEEDQGGLGTADGLYGHAGRADSVEILPSFDPAEKVEMRPIDYGQQGGSVSRPESSKSDDDQQVTFLGHGQYAIQKRDQAQKNQDGARRMLAWEQARTRVRQPQANKLLYHGGKDLGRTVPENSRISSMTGTKFLDRSPRSTSGVYQQDRILKQISPQLARSGLATAAATRENCQNQGHLSPAGHGMREHSDHRVLVRQDSRPNQPVSVLSQRRQYLVSDSITTNPYPMEQDFLPRSGTTDNRPMTVLEQPDSYSHDQEHVLPSIEVSPRVPRAQNVLPGRRSSGNMPFSEIRDARDMQSLNNRGGKLDHVEGPQILRRTRFDTVAATPISQHDGPADYRRSALIPIRYDDDPSQASHRKISSQLAGFSNQHFTESRVLSTQTSLRPFGTCQQDTIPLRLDTQNRVHSPAVSLSQHTQIFLPPIPTQSVLAHPPLRSEYPVHQDYLNTGHWPARSVLYNATDRVPSSRQANDNNTKEATFAEPMQVIGYPGQRHGEDSRHMYSDAGPSRQHSGHNLTIQDEVRGQRRLLPLEQVHPTELPAPIRIELQPREHFHNPRWDFRHQPAATHQLSSMSLGQSHQVFEQQPVAQKPAATNVFHGRARPQYQASHHAGEPVVKAMGEYRSEHIQSLQDSRARMREEGLDSQRIVQTAARAVGQSRLIDMRTGREVIMLDD